MRRIEVQRVGTVWWLLAAWDDEGLRRTQVLATSPDPRAIEAACRLLGGEP